MDTVDGGQVVPDRRGRAYSAGLDARLRSVERVNGGPREHGAAAASDEGGERRWQSRAPHRARLVRHPEQADGRGIAQASGWRKIAGSGDDGGRAVACHSHAHLATTSPAARPSKWARYARHARSPQREIRTTKMQAKKAGPGWRHHEERRHVGPSLPSSLIRLILLSIFSLSYLIDKIREIRLHLSYLIRP